MEARYYLSASLLICGLSSAACSGGLFSTKVGGGSKERNVSRVEQTAGGDVSIKYIESVLDRQTNPYRSVFIDYDSDEASEDVSYTISESLGAPLSDFDFSSEKDALLVGSTARQYYSHGDVTAMALVMSDKERNLGVNQEEFASTDLEIFIETLGNFEDDLAAGAGTGNSDTFFEDDTNNFIDPGADDVFLPVPDFSVVEEDVILDQTPEVQEVDTLESAVSSRSAPLPEMQASEDQNRSLSNAIMTQSTAGSSIADSAQPPSIAEVVQSDINNFQNQYGNVTYVNPSDPSITENPKIEILSDGTKKETKYDEGSTSVKIASPSGKTETVIVNKEGVVARAVNGLNGDASVLQYHAVDKKTGEVNAQLAAFDSSDRFRVAIAEHQQTDLRLVDGHLWLFIMDAAGKVVKKYDCGAKGAGIGSDEIKDCLIDEEPVEPEPQPEPEPEPEPEPDSN